MDVFVTVISGVLIFVSSQILLKMIIDPVHMLKKHIGKIAHNMDHLAPYYSNPGTLEDDVLKEVKEKIRMLASDLSEAFYLVPYYKKIHRIFGLPSFDDVLTANSRLIGLSNSLLYARHADNNLMRAQKIQDCLGIFIPKHERVDV